MADEVLDHRPSTTGDDFAASSAPPAWPKVVGTLSIVFGSLSIMCTGFGMISAVFFTPWIARQMEAQADGPVELPPNMQFDPQMWLYMAAGVATNVLLVIAGILVLSRLKAGRGAHLVYAVMELGAIAWGIVITIRQHAAMDQFAADHPGNPFIAQRNEAVEWGIAAAMFVIAACWPVFCLIWFGLVKKSERDFKGSETQQLI